MFKNINKIFIWIVGLIICYVFYNVFILENFTSSDEKNKIYRLNSTIRSIEKSIKNKKKNTPIPSAEITQLEEDLSNARAKLSSYETSIKPI